MNNKISNVQSETPYKKEAPKDNSSIDKKEFIEDIKVLFDYLKNCSVCVLILLAALHIGHDDQKAEWYRLASAFIGVVGLALAGLNMMWYVGSTKRKNWTFVTGLLATICVFIIMFVAISVTK